MRILVCGGRDYDNWLQLESTLCELAYDFEYKITIIQGGAKGADFLARVWAKVHDVDWEEYPAQWATEGKAAGAIRNQKMLDQAKPNLVIAFPGGRGTADMVSRAKKAGVEVIEIGTN